MRSKQPAAINTYDTEKFRARYMKHGAKLDSMLKAGIAEFFIVQVQDLIRLIKLPVPPVRSVGYTFIYLTHGDATMTIGSDTYTIYKNECLFVPAGQVYSFKTLDINKGYLCHVSPGFTTGTFGVAHPEKEFDFLNVWGNPCVKLNSQSAAHVQQLLKHLYNNYTRHGLNNRALLQTNFNAVLCEINLAYQPPANNNQQAQPVALSNQFKKLLTDNARTIHRVADYAALLHVTPNHLNKVVKKVTGKSPTVWIDEVRMLEAKVLLYQTGNTIAQVAAAIGIDDASYFARVFKKHEGVTPAQYRQGIEKYHNGHK